MGLFNSQKLQDLHIELFPIYSTDVQAAGVPAGVTAWADAIRAADGVIIVSPEYNWSIPAGLKNAIDWASREKNVCFKDKPVALQSASGGQVGGARMQYHLRMALTAIEAQMFTKPEVFVNFAAKKVDDKNELNDDGVKTVIKQQLAAFATFVKRVSAK